MRYIKYPLKTIITILFGSLLLSIAYNTMYIPNKMLSGGVTGIAMLLNLLFDLPVSLMVFLLNIPLFIVGLIYINRRFIVYSIIGTVSLSLFLSMTDHLVISSDSIITPILLGGVLNGLGIGLIFRVNASTGGSDIISKILNKYLSMNMATVGFLVNTVIIALSVFYFDIDIAVYTLATMYISSLITNYVVEGLNYKKSVFIITDMEEEVAQAIIANVQRGVTIIPCKGAFTGMDRAVLFCVIGNREIGKLRNLVKSIDNKAFITITQTAQVYGNGRGFYNINSD